MSVSPQVTAPVALTMADLLEQLGDIVPSRVRLHPAPGEATEADVVAARDRENRLFELVNGVLVEKPMGLREVILAAVLIRVLGEFVHSRRLGVLAAPDGMMRLFPGTVRMPDVSFISWARFPQGGVTAQPTPSIAPDLAVEILSASNTVAEMERKRREYFAAGTRLVWIVDIDPRTIAVYTGPENPTILHDSDILDGGEVLPGFRASVAEIFDELRRPAP